MKYNFIQSSERSGNLAHGARRFYPKRSRGDGRASLQHEGSVARLCALTLRNAVTRRPSRRRGVFLREDGTTQDADRRQTLAARFPKQHVRAAANGEAKKRTASETWGVVFAAFLFGRAMVVSPEGRFRAGASVHEDAAGSSECVRAATTDSWPDDQS